MSRPGPHPTQLCSEGSQDAPLPPPPLPPPPAVPKPSSRSGASLGGPPPWGLSCLLALQVGGKGAGVGADRRECLGEWVWHEKPCRNRYFCLFLKIAPSHSSTYSISWSWLLCSVPPTCSCFEVSPKEDFLTLLPSSWPPAFSHAVCLLPCKLGWAAGEGELPGERGMGSRGVGEAGGVLLAVTVFQTCRGCCSYRLPLVQAPSLEFLVPALVLTSQKLPLAIQTPGNCEHRARTRGEGGVGSVQV